MKTTIRPLTQNWFYLILLVLSITTACQPEEPLVSPNAPQPSSTTQVQALTCTKRAYIFSAIPNYKRDPNSLTRCVYAPNYFCIRRQVFFEIRCWLPDNYFDPFKPICLSCPPDIFKHLPYERIPDFRYDYTSSTQLNWKESATMFPITSGVLGLQFYAESKAINQQRYVLQESLILSAEEQKALGVSGKGIPAGTYPVVYNPKNNTYNALVAFR